VYNSSSRPRRSGRSNNKAMPVPDVCGNVQLPGNIDATELGFETIQQKPAVTTRLQQRQWLAQQ
jgi:hypothetical protein